MAAPAGKSENASPAFENPFELEGDPYAGSDRSRSNSEAEDGKEIYSKDDVKDDVQDDVKDEAVKLLGQTCLSWFIERKEPIPFRPIHNPTFAAPVSTMCLKFVYREMKACVSNDEALNELKAGVRDGNALMQICANPSDEKNEKLRRWFPTMFEWEWQVEHRFLLEVAQRLSLAAETCTHQDGDTALTYAVRIIKATGILTDILSSLKRCSRLLIGRTSLAWFVKDVYRKAVMPVPPATMDLTHWAVQTGSMCMVKIAEVLGEMDEEDIATVTYEEGAASVNLNWFIDPKEANLEKARRYFAIRDPAVLQWEWELKAIASVAKRICAAERTCKVHKDDSALSFARRVVALALANVPRIPRAAVRTGFL